MLLDHQVQPTSYSNENYKLNLIIKDNDTNDSP